MDATPTGTLFIALYVAGTAGLIGLMGIAGYFLLGKASQSKAWAVAHQAYVIAQSVVAHVEAKVRPTIQRALADGSLSAGERGQIQAKAMALFKEALGNELPNIKKVLGLTSDGALDTFLSGLLEQALAVFKGGPPAVLPGQDRIDTPLERPARPL